MMEEDNRKLLKSSLEIIKNNSDQNDGFLIKTLLLTLDDKELDESTLNEFVHYYFSSNISLDDGKSNFSYERNARK